MYQSRLATVAYLGHEVLLEAIREGALELAQVRDGLAEVLAVADVFLLLLDRLDCRLSERESSLNLGSRIINVRRPEMKDLKDRPDDTRWKTADTSGGYRSGLVDGSEFPITPFHSSMV